MGGRGSVGRPRVLFFRRFGGGRRRGFASRRGRGGHDDAPWNHHSRRHLWLLLGCLGFLGRWPFLVVVGLLFSTWNLLLSCMTVPSSVTLDGLGFDFGNLIEEGVQIVGHLPLARRSVSQSGLGSELRHLAPGGVHASTIEERKKRKISWWVKAAEKPTTSGRSEH